MVARMPLGDEPLARPGSRRLAVAAALAAALLSVPATYAALRGYDVLFKSEPDPATIIWSARIAMFWRLGVGAYVAGMLALPAYALARRDPARTLRLLCALVVPVGALLAAQAALLP